MRFAALPLGLAPLALAAPPALADSKPAYDPREAHAESDTNDDGYVDRAEFHARMVEVFFFGDADRNGFLTPLELQNATPFPEDFRYADSNRDGRISLYEYQRVRFYDFDLVDTDRDGRLSLEEIVVVFERGGVRR